MKIFKIVTKEKSDIPRFKWGAILTFLTSARTGKSALNRLIKKSCDFRSLMDADEFQITIKELK